MTKWALSQGCKDSSISANQSIQYTTFNSVQFSHSIASDTLQPHESQHTRPPCPSLSPRIHSNSCPSSQWRHPAISSSVVPFSSCPQSLPASESFAMSQLFAWGGQSTGVSDVCSSDLDWFADIEESLHPWDKAHLVMVYDLFNVLLDSDC